MADLSDKPQWVDGVYQLENTDAMEGGPPDAATLAGVDNVPHDQINRRVQFLRVAMEAPNAVTDLTIADSDFVYARDGELLQNISGAAITVTLTDAATLVALGFVDTGLQLGGLRSVPVPVARRLPAIESLTNRLSLTSGTGTLTVDPGQSWIWRDAVRISSSEFAEPARSFALSASRHYQLRWHAPGTGDAAPRAMYPAGRLVLRDITAQFDNAREDLGVQYDSQFDDMLIAQIAVDAGGLPTVKPLINAAAYSRTIEVVEAPVPAGNAQVRSDTVPLDLAVTPEIIAHAFSFATDGGAAATDEDTEISVTARTRESFDYAINRDFGTVYRARFTAQVIS